MRPFRHVLVRALLALLAILTTAAPAAAAVGEGVLAARAGRSPAAVHVEDARQAGCPYVHADDCVLCAVLGVHALPAAVRVPPTIPIVACAPARAPESTQAVAHAARLGRHARGPPTG